MNTDGYHIILASGSPRRKELMAGLDIDFEIRLLPGIDESYPADLPTSQIAEYIAGRKAEAYKPDLRPGDILIAADTIVVLDGKVIGKPKDEADARRILSLLSGRTHEVLTGVCILQGPSSAPRTFTVRTEVDFAPLRDEDIAYYISRYRPLDKAGAYGIQEWIGYVGIKAIRGSYYNVMGLPIQRIYAELRSIIMGKSTTAGGLLR